MVKKISVSIDEDVFSELERLGKKFFCTKSRLITEVLRRSLSSFKSGEFFQDAIE